MKPDRIQFAPGTSKWTTYATHAGVYGFASVADATRFVTMIMAFIGTHEISHVAVSIEGTQVEVEIGPLEGELLSDSAFGLAEAIDDLFELTQRSPAPVETLA